MEDNIRKMLSTQRRLITEQTDNTQGLSITNDAKYGENELSKEKESLINALNSNVIFGDNPLIVYPESHNVIFTGTVVDMNNLKFQFSFADSTGGCYMSVENLALNETNIKKVNQLYNYYLNWKKDWLKKLPSYIKKNNESPE